MAILGDTKATSLVVSGTSTLASINANSTGLGTNGQILKSTGTGIAWADPAGTHNHDGAYVNVTGDTMTGALIIKKITAATNTYDDANPKIIFQNSNASQNASLTFTDYDTIQSPASLTLNGNQGGEYFIAPNIKATSNFYGSGANLTSLNASNLASGTVPIARIPTGTSETTVALGNHTHNYAGSSSAGGAATSLANFKVTTSTNLWAVDSPTTNAIGYQSGLTKANWNYQQTDGAIYDQFYSSSWIHQIFGDYRTGQISVRGKNNGTWQAWRRVLDETNASTILGLGTLATKSSINNHSVTTPTGATSRTADVAVNTTTVNSITAVGTLPSLTVTDTDVVTGGTTTAIPNISKKTVVTGVTKKTVVTGGSTTDVPNIAKKTVVTSATAAKATYANGILTISDGSVTTGDSVTVGTAIKAYTSLTTGDSVTVTTGDSVTVGTAINAYTALTTSSIGSASGWSAGTLPTKGSNTTVATGIKTQPTFTVTTTTTTLSHTIS